MQKIEEKSSKENVRNNIKFYVQGIYRKKSGMEFI